MTFHLIQRRTVVCPTLWGWACLAVLAGVLCLVGWFESESFLSLTQRLPAEVLVVEGWIGEEGIHAAGAEFRQGGYQYIVTTSGLTNNRWDPHQWSYAEMAESALIRAGIPQDKIIVAAPKNTEGQRTFESALAVFQALQVRGIRLTALNVFTFGCHARRSRLIFAKVFRPTVQVGVISWTPPNYKSGPWWRSSDRAEDLIKETIGYAFEVLFNSGRASNAPPERLLLNSAPQP
jgi:hypothetical protein